LQWLEKEKKRGHTFAKKLTVSNGRKEENPHYMCMGPKETPRLPKGRNCLQILVDKGRGGQDIAPEGDLHIWREEKKDA